MFYVGHSNTLWILIAANLLLGAFFVVRGGSPSELTAETEAATQEETASLSVTAIVQANPVSMVVLAALSGFLAGALQGDMYKRIAFVGANTSAAMSLIALWAILAIFLASSLVSVANRLKLIHVKLLTGFSLVFYAIAWWNAYQIIYLITKGNHEEAIRSNPDLALNPIWATQSWSGLHQVMLFEGVMVLPAYFFVSLLLPYVCNRIQQNRRHLGLAYGLNTLAFCLGVVSFTWLAPSVNIFYSLKLVFVVMAIGWVLILAIPESRKPSVGTFLAAAAAAVVGCLLTSAEFDPSYVKRGSTATKYEVHAMRSNAAHTTYVVEEPSGKTLFFDSHPMSATSAYSQRYMRLMAHFPLLAHPDPKSALLICFGVGNTASAMATHETLDRIDIVDLNYNVLQTAPEFSATNNNVVSDPRVRLFCDDGRNFLKVTNQTYDLITSEPPPPMQAGVYRLYSREYYQEAIARLSPQGMMTQWVPAYQMGRNATELAVATFVQVFPHTLLFTGQAHEFILVGSKSPIDLRQVERRFYEQSEVLADLRSIDIDRPISLLARIVQGDATLRRRWDATRILSDQHNDFAHLFLDPNDPTIIDYQPLDMLREIKADRLSSGGQLRDVVTHLGYLDLRVDDFPAESMMTVRSQGADGVAGTDVDWIKFRWMLSQTGRLQRQGHIEKVIKMYRDATRYSDDLVVAYNDLAWILATHEDKRLPGAAEAVRLAERACEITGHQEALLLDTLAVAYAAAGRFDDAVRTAEQAIKLAQEERQHELADEIQSRLNDYRKGDVGAP